MPYLGWHPHYYWLNEEKVTDQRLHPKRTGSTQVPLMLSFLGTRPVGPSCHAADHTCWDYRSSLTGSPKVKGPRIQALPGMAAGFTPYLLASLATFGSRDQRQPDHRLSSLTRPVGLHGSLAHNLTHSSELLQLYAFPGVNPAYADAGMLIHLRRWPTRRKGVSSK